MFPVSLHVRSGVATITLILMLSTNLKSQPDSCREGKIMFNGISSLNYNWCSNLNPGQMLPASYLNWNLRAQVIAFGLPFSINGLYSSISDSSTQRRNFLTFQFDPRSMLALKYGSRKGFAFKHIEFLELGQTRPRYSDLMLNGITLKGINLGIKAGSFHVYGAYGNSQEVVREGYLWNQRYEQVMAYGALAFGKPRGSYIRVSFLHAGDLKGSLDGEVQYYVQQADTFIHLTDTFFLEADSIALSRKPGESLLLGVEAGLSLWKNKLTLLAEAAGSAHTSNTESEALIMDEVPAWVFEIFQPRISTALSYALKGSANLDLRYTNVSASLSHIEPGYYSPGVPFMRHDNQSFDFRAKQDFFKRKLQTTAWARAYRGVPESTRDVETSDLAWGMGIAWRPVKLPYLNLSFSPHSRSQSSEVGDIEVTSLVMNLSTGKNYILRKKVNAFTGINFSLQLLDARNVVKQEMQGTYMSLQQGLRFKAPFSLSASIMYSEVVVNDEQTISGQAGLMISYRYKQQFHCSAGLRHSFRQNGDQRTVLSLNMGVQIGKAGTLSLVAEPHHYRSLNQPAYTFDQYVVRCSFITKLKSKK
jgi:hypothetical protein